MAEAAVADDAPVEQPVEKKGKGKLFIIIGLVVLLLAGAGGGAWYFMQSSAKADKKDAKHAKAEPVKKGPALYVALDPPFVVNFKAQSMVRFLQVSVQIMTRDVATQALIKENDPIIRNDLLTLFGELEYETISTVEGKEVLRKGALNAVRKIVKDEGGKADLVEAVYFTSFVMQ